MEAALESRRIESFYHLSSNQDLSGNCRGLACFVARNQNLQRWQAAEAQSQRIFCLGKCYASPATCDLDERPLVRVLARRAVVLDQIADSDANELLCGGNAR
jgi:formate dehydrogenase iron-sulfur subunit